MKINAINHSSEIKRNEEKKIVCNSDFLIFFEFTEKDYKGYLPLDILESGVKSGRFVQGHINVNRNDAGQEAFVRQKRCLYS